MLALVGLAAPARAVPLPGFVENRGQEDPRVAFSAQTPYGTVYVTHAREIVYVVPEPDDWVAPPDGAIGTATKPAEKVSAAGRLEPRDTLTDGRMEKLSDPRRPTNGVDFDLGSQWRDRPTQRRLLAIYETVVGAGPGEINGLDRQPTAVQYFIGNDPAGWLADVPVYARLDLGEVAPGIRLGLHLREGGVEKVFTVEPGASLDALRLRIEGAAGIERGPTARLELLTDTGRLAFTRPMAWQLDQAGRRVPVSVGYDVADGTYGFVTGPHDPSRPLFIDPLLAATYVGGTWIDTTTDVARSDDGSVFVTGVLGTPAFPTVPGSYDPLFDYYDVFVAKMDEDLSSLRALTYLGGTLGDEPGKLVWSRQTGLVVSGLTASEDFPTTPGALQTQLSVQRSLFVSVFSDNLRRLSASSYLGGNNVEELGDLAVDATGNVVLVGQTLSRDWPTTPDAYQPTPPRPYLYGDVFVTKLSPDLSTPIASSYFGGEEGASIAYAVVADPWGTIYIAGNSWATDLPVSEDAFDTEQRGVDGFVARFDGGLTTRLACTFFGGGNNDYVRGLALDAQGNVWIAGFVVDGGIPVTPGAYSTQDVAGFAPYVASLSADLTSLKAATYLHTPGHGEGQANGEARFLAIDPIDQSVVVGGQAWNEGYPVPDWAYQTRFRDNPDQLNQEVFVVRLTRVCGQTGKRRHEHQ